MFTLLVLVIQPNISHVPSHTLYSKLRHAVVNEEDLELCSLISSCSESQMAASVNDIISTVHLICFIILFQTLASQL